MADINFTGNADLDRVLSASLNCVAESSAMLDLLHELDDGTDPAWSALVASEEAELRELEAEDSFIVGGVLDWLSGETGTSH
jgi:hypothetical protein